MTDVTVLMTVYNGMPYLPLAIESILGQTYADFEFLIVNDCSSDESRDVILGYDDSRIRLVDNHKNLNQTRSLNRGLEKTNTRWVARMDADDISHPRRIEKQMAYLRRHPDVVAAGTGLRYIDSLGRVTGVFEFPEKDLALRWMQLFDCPVSCGAVMFDKEIIWDRLGGFEPSIRYAQDWELWSRVLTGYRLANVPEKLVDVRQHPGASSSAAFVPMLAEQRRIIRENPKRILGMDDTTDGWFKRVDTLLDKRLSKPWDRMDVIDILYDRFCENHPEAENDPDVLRILAGQYIEVLYYTRFPRQLQVLARYKKALSGSPKLSSFFFRGLGSALKQFPGHLKYWIPRNFLGADH